MSRSLRIVSLLPGATEMVFALGLGEQLVAVSHECDYPPAAQSLPKVTRSRINTNCSGADIDRQTRQLYERGEPLFELDITLLTALKPDLILTQSQCEVCAVALADVERWFAGVPQLRHAELFSLNAHRFRDLFDDLYRLAGVIGAENRARNLVDHLTSRVEQVRCHVARLERRPRVACLEWLAPPILGGHWMAELVELAGGSAVGPAPGERSSVTSWHTLAEAAAEYIVCMPCGFTLMRTCQEVEQVEVAVWKELEAWRRGRVYAVDGSAYFNRVGPRLIDSLEILAQLIHPELWGHLPAYPHAWRQITPGKV